jgi:hypothetical protein
LSWARKERRKQKRNRVGQGGRREKRAGMEKATKRGIKKKKRY